jgi:hypothetical protein
MRLSKNTIISSVMTLVLLLGASSGLAYGDAYSVSASVPYPAPTQAAVINPNLDNTTVNDALQTIDGTCQVQNPAIVVSIWRGSSSLGSTTCNSGTFSLQVMLQSGSNVLIARSASISDQYGPDSQPVTITLNLPNPSTQPPAPNGTTPPSTTGNIRLTTNAGAGAGLTIIPATPFSILSTSNDVTITLTISGGKQPYTLFLNWGDGSTETYSILAAGGYSFSHTYAHAGKYTTHIQVQDARGALAEYTYIIVSPVKKSAPSPVVRTHISGSGTTSALIFGGWAIFWGLLLIGLGYLLGWHDAKRRFRKAAKAKSAKIKSSVKAK